MEHTTSMALLLRFISIVSVLDVTISSMPVQIISRIIAVSADSMLIVQMLIGKMRFTLDMSERRNAVNNQKLSGVIIHGIRLQDADTTVHIAMQEE